MGRGPPAGRGGGQRSRPPCSDRWGLPTWRPDGKDAGEALRAPVARPPRLVATGTATGTAGGAAGGGPHVRQGLAGPGGGHFPAGAVGGPLVAGQTHAQCLARHYTRAGPLRRAGTAAERPSTHTGAPPAKAHHPHTRPAALTGANATTRTAHRDNRPRAFTEPALLDRHCRPRAYHAPQGQDASGPHAATRTRPSTRPTNRPAPTAALPPHSAHFPPPSATPGRRTGAGPG